MFLADTFFGTFLWGDQVRIGDLRSLGSLCIKGTGEITLVTDSSDTLMHHDPDRSWITDLDPDRLKLAQSPNLRANKQAPFDLQLSKGDCDAHI